MCRRKPKMLKYRIRKIKILWIVLHIILFCTGIPFGFTVSCSAVWKAWTSVYPTPVSSTFSLPQRQLYTHCLLRSFA